MFMPRYAHKGGGGLGPFNKLLRKSAANLTAHAHGCSVRLDRLSRDGLILLRH